MSDKTFKVKAFMDALKDDASEILDAIFNNLDYKYDDDVLEFELVIKNQKNITEEVGVDEGGYRAFGSVEVEEILE